MEAVDWKSVPVYVLDFEGSAASGVVEYGVVRLLGGRIDHVETDLCRPAGFISARDREVHGIRDEEARGREPFAALYAAFVAYRRAGLFAAHNRAAENSFMKNAWPVPPPVPDWRGGTAGAQEWGPWIDTLAIYRTLYPGLESYALEDLVARFGCGDALAAEALARCPEGRRGPHCALYDALACAGLLLRLEGDAGLAGRITVGWLLQLSRGIETQQELF